MSFMQSNRPRFITSALSCLVAACLLPGQAGAAEPDARAVAPAAAKPPSPVGTAPAAANQAGAAAGASPSPEVMLEAKQRFDRGFDLYEEGEYPLALIEFNRAYELVPNYRVLYNIGQVCIQLGQYANARRTLEEYMKQGADALGADRREAVKKDLDMLGRRTAFVTINGNVEGAEVLVDDVAVGKTPLGPALLVDAGVHRVTLRRQGYLPRTTNVTLAGGDEQTVAVALELQPEQKQTIVVREREIVDDSAKNWMIAGWVTTGALVTGAVVTGILGAGEADELAQLRKGDSSQYDEGELQSRIDDTKNNASTLLLASDVLSGAALIVGGLSLWVTLDPWEPEHVAPLTEPAATARKSVQVGYEAGQLKVRGSF